MVPDALAFPGPRPFPQRFPCVSQETLNECFQCFPPLYRGGNTGNAQSFVDGGR